MKKIYLLCLLISVLGFSCKTDFDGNTPIEINIPFDTIRSCPGGGGLFIISLPESVEISDAMKLSLTASSGLNASLSNLYLDCSNRVSEIIIKPDMTIQPGYHTVVLSGRNSTYRATAELTVEIFDWSPEINDGLIARKEAFLSWLNYNRSDLNLSPDNEWLAFPTYPQIIIVEHVTFLNDEFEMRVCLHAMMKPDDWSMLRLRRRNETEPFLALRQETEGSEINIIRVEEYPSLLGY